ncbi:hypothetical protein BCR33DRAFT_853999 [Rhizoclosmatium globosum]|uniref:Uncharacterized protein n=1 Tax=Rhizoclosmatium globosum TaxID=329046 RepID=A0A1Y2BVP9_9FUNG|nr:hypothetical protein BCR33DRAFT_853999 [Rhizoclosmatium globosum]|eukprot:ORY38707.1 hypothetical protein BCR33DRAFT_853999 [Rhizoclosmatium globosum]
MGGDTGGIVGLPNWSFTVALWSLKMKLRGKLRFGTLFLAVTDILKTALLQYPTFPSLLLSKLTLTDPTITNSQLFSLPPGHPRTKSEESIHLLLQLYTERCHHLWKEPSALAWFRATASTLAKTVSLEDPQVLEFTTKREEIDFQALVPFLPDDIARYGWMLLILCLLLRRWMRRRVGWGIMGVLVDCGAVAGLMAARGGDGVGDEDDDEDWVDGNEVDEEMMVMML